MEYLKSVFNKEYRNINTHSDAVQELPPGTVAGSALCAFRYMCVYMNIDVDMYIHDIYIYIYTEREREASVCDVRAIAVSKHSVAILQC